MENIGVLGLGTMGKNLALNISNHGYNVHVFNRTFTKTQELVNECSKIKGFETLESFVDSLARPKKIILMLTAGNPIDLVLEELDSLLDPSDIVIDGGNSYFMDTIRRGNSYKFNYVGCGVSEGEYGALHGPSIMVGCKKEIYKKIGPILESISAKHLDSPCCKWLEEDGAGHFVKIVHNGIEYCEMQLLQEVLNIIKIRDFEKGQKTYESYYELLKTWNSGRLGGYLLEICIKILEKKNGNDYVLDQIEDQAKQKGTGKMCISSAIELECDIVGMTESVLARFLSQKKEKRIAVSESLKINENLKVSANITNEDLTGAFFLCKAISYIQGSNLLLDYKKSKGWSYSIPDICEVWREGCILRCKFLDELKVMSGYAILETSPAFIKIYKDNIERLKRVCKYGVEAGLYIPLFTSSLMWLNGMKLKDGNGDLIQAMRDYFGRHGVVLKKGGETVNIEWDE